MTRNDVNEAVAPAEVTCDIGCTCLGSSRPTRQWTKCLFSVVLTSARQRCFVNADLTEATLTKWFREHQVRCSQRPGDHSRPGQDHGRPGHQPKGKHMFLWGCILLVIAVSCLAAWRHDRRREIRIITRTAAEYRPTIIP
jgi:hypothetical protein